MFKKLIIAILVLAVIALSTIPLWTSKIAEDAFENPKDKNAPKKIKEAMLVKIRIHRYEQARMLAEKAILYFPRSKELPYFIYNAAKCAEQEKEPYVAIYWYQEFLKKFPEHTWAQQAKNKLTKIKELHSIE